MKDTDKVTLTLGQIKKLIAESKGKKKMLKESGLSTGQDVIRDLVDRAQSIIDEGEEDTSEAVRQAIDEGLIYTDDILSLLRYYGTISDNEIIQSYYDELFDDVIKDVEIPDSDDEEDEESDEEDDSEEE